MRFIVLSTIPDKSEVFVDGVRAETAAVARNLVASIRDYACVAGVFTPTQLGAPADDMAALRAAACKQVLEAV